MSVKYNFQGHKILVTGGGTGVGKAIVKKFIEAGCTSIFVIDINEQLIQQLVEEFPAVTAVQGDVSNWEQTSKQVESFGPIDHLINNAGIPEANDFMDVTQESINKIFGINFTGIVNISQTVARGMIEQGKGGTIVNISSVLDTMALQGASMYSCTKAAVTTLTKAMALELAPHNIRVNCVRPTVMHTNLISDLSKQHIAKHVVETLTTRQTNKRLLTVEETADSVLFLCSNASSMVNGSNILVDGGLYTN